MKKIKILTASLFCLCIQFTQAQDVNNELLKQSRYCELEEVKALIAKGANINYADEEGKTAIMEALSKGNDCKEVIDYLMSNPKINLKLKDKETNNLLHIISEGDDLVGYVSKLKLAGLDINALNKNDETPLIKAVKEKNALIVKELIQNGADINSKLDEQTAFDIAIEKDKDDVIVEFTNAKITKEQASKIICYCETEETILKAIEAGADVNTTSCSDDKLPLLIKVVEDGNVALIETLLKKGANINCKDTDGVPAFFYATDETALKTLLIYKPDLNAVDSNGVTIAQDYIDSYIGRPGISTGLSNLKIIVDNGYKIPSTIAGKPIIKYINDFVYTISYNDKTKPEVLASIKEKNNAKKQEVIDYLKSKGVK